MLLVCIAESLNGDEDSDNEGDSDPVPEPSTSNETTSSELKEVYRNKTVKNMGKAVVKRRPWTAEEQTAVKRHLDKYFFTEKLPGKHEIEEARRQEPLLMNRHWVQIKSFIKNTKLSMKRKLYLTKTTKKCW